MKKSILLSLLVGSSVFAETKLDALQEQVKQQQIQLDTLQTKNTNQSASFSQLAYMPDMAFILNMSALTRDVTNSNYENYAIPGFVTGGKAEILFNKLNGFNFNYAEVDLHSVVDPYFDAFAIFHLQSDVFEVEEAFVQTTSLPYGMRVKAGKFRSAFGRLNAKHQHTWSFDNQPLIQEGLFGPDSLKDAGIQLQWVAPTDTYLMIGAEAMQGSNEVSFGDSEPNLLVSYVKSSVDIGDDLSILGGASIAHGKNTTSNLTNIYGADLTLRYQLDSYSSLIFQSEYLKKEMDIDTSTDKQSGLYSELNYQMNNYYSFGARYEKILENEAASLNAYTVDTNNLARYTLKVDYKPFELSRFRLQFTRDASKIIAGQRRNFNEVLLSLNIAAGAHGAHNY